MKNLPSLAEKTPKAQRTKEHILDTALGLFATKGYAETTLRDIAREAQVSLGLTYRYYARKEDLLLALYERLTTECAAQVRMLPKGPMGQRFAGALNETLDLLQPYREALSSLFAVGLTANSEMAVLGDRASGVRAGMWELYRGVVAGASDAPKGKQCEQISTLLYSGHLLVILFWMQDRSEEQAKTRDLIKFAGRMLQRVRPFLGLRMVATPLAQLNQILLPMFGPTVS